MDFAIDFVLFFVSSSDKFQYQIQYGHLLSMLHGSFKIMYSMHVQIFKMCLGN